MLPEEARVYALSISAAFHHFTHTHSHHSTPDVCCQICSPHTELKKIRRMAKRQISLTPVQINLIQSEDCDWDSLPSPSSFDESTTASLINSNQRSVRQTDCFSVFYFPIPHGCDWWHRDCRYATKEKKKAASVHVYLASSDRHSD